MAAHACNGRVDSLVEELGGLQIQPNLPISEVLEQELRFLEMFTRYCRSRVEKAGGIFVGVFSAIDSPDAVLVSVPTDNSNLLLRFLKKITCCLRKSETAGEFFLVNQVRSEPPTFMEKIDLMIREDCAVFSKIREDCVVLLDSLKSMSWSVKEILAFIVCLVSNLKRLSNLQAEIFVSVKNQIMLLIEKFSFLEILLHFFVKYCTESQELKDFLDNHVMNWLHGVATLSLLCLLGNDENVPEILETMLSDLLQKVKLCSTPEVIKMFIELLKDSKPSRSDKLLAGQTVATLVDFLLESVTDPLKEYVAILRDGLIFMITFYMDPPEKAAQGRLFTRIDVVVNEILSHIFSLCMDEFVEVDISLGAKVSLSSLQHKIVEVKIEIRKLIDVRLSNPLDLDFPAINSMWFINSFLENIKEMVKPNSMIAFARHQVVIVQEELLFFRPFIKDIMELQQERTELKGVWTGIMNMVLVAEYVIASCSVVDHPIWYDMLWLSDVIQAIKLTQSEVKKHKGQIYNAKMISTITCCSDIPVKQANSPSLLQDHVVGMRDESENIIDKLTRGTEQLDIVSIVGMPGLGKTTMAKRVYNDPSVKCYFHLRAWCCVSQVCNSRELYFDILSDVTGVDARKSYSSNSDDDLAEKLRKCLKGRRYLVVFDDIWSIKAWNNMKESLPDDHNGSRIVFTSRIHDLVSQAKLNCIPHLLRTLTNEESMELFEKKLSQKDSCPPDDIGEIAENIVKNCQGLPLAVVLVAGVLAGTNIGFWEEVEKSTVSKVFNDRGCMDVVELSYKHLPDHLKPCFLYFGAFTKDKVVSSEKLMNLWIGEGFIPRSDDNSVYKVAETYLSDLICRSLVILATRNCSGGIEGCHVHDLLHDLCSRKIREENFLQRVQNSGVSRSSLNYSYRLCIDTGLYDSSFTETRSTSARSIICVDDIAFGYSEGPFSLLLSEHFKLLNVLDLAGTRIEIDFVATGITFMVNLRYLSIYSCKFWEIPECIANLWNLETFIVKRGKDCGLPSSFWKMKSLRYVNLYSIRDLGIKPHEFGELQQMDTFARASIPSSDEMKELSRRLPGLRKLDCAVRFLDSSEFSCFTDLETLDAYYYSTIWVEGQPLPTFGFPNSLKNLTLWGLGLPWGTISIIGGLPNLEILKLKSDAFKGRKWETGDGEFSKLKFLELSSLDIEQWIIPDEYNDSFPNLERLVLKYCRKLERIPSSLVFIPTLNKIEVRCCSKVAAASAMEILQEQQDMGNDGLEVLCIGSEY